MGLLHDAEPFLAGQLVRTDDRPHFVDQDFRRGAWQCLQPRLLESLQELTDGQAQGLRPVLNLQW